LRIYGLRVYQTVQPATLGVKSRTDYIEVIRIAGFITPEHGVCHMIGELYHSRSTGINEHGNIGHVSQNTPASTDRPKTARQLLESRLIRAVIQNNQAALGILLSMVQTSEL